LVILFEKYTKSENFNPGEKQFYWTKRQIGPGRRELWKLRFAKRPMKKQHDSAPKWRKYFSKITDPDSNVKNTPAHFHALRIS